MYHDSYIYWAGCVALRYGFSETEVKQRRELG